MSVVSITSTDAQLDFSFGRTARQKRRVISGCDALPVFADYYWNYGNLRRRGRPILFQEYRTPVAGFC